MTQPIDRDAIYSGRCFSAETIELCVRWYITYRLSYRDLAAMMAERDVIVSHTTIMRWVLRYAPEYECRWARFSRPPGESWRMDGNGGVGPWRSALPISSRGQERKIHWVSALQ